MESRIVSDERQKELENWVFTQGVAALSFLPLPADASFRRYFRIVTNTQTLIAMDAPLAQENCLTYIQIANGLRMLGLITPEIFAADLSEGFLLISDFGDETFLKKLNSVNVESMYSSALQSLAILQSCKKISGHTIPIFDATWMWNEWQWHKEWFLHKLLKLDFLSQEKTLDECYSHIVHAAVSQPQVFMHRDFHSANLMSLPQNKVGILDFQDAFIGPATYDLVSLLRDCYIDWPKEFIQQLALDYYTQHPEVFADINKKEFLRYFDFMGIQRHLKALFTFARKHVRDQQSKYLQYVPRTIQYLINVTGNYAELQNLHEFYKKIDSQVFSNSR